MFLSEPRFENLPMIFEGPGFGGKQAERRDVEAWSACARGGAARARLGKCEAPRPRSSGRAGGRAEATLQDATSGCERNVLELTRPRDV